MYNILLISAPYIEQYGPIRLAAGRYFPLGLGYIAAVLRKEQFPVILCEPEAQGYDFEDIAALMIREKPKVVAISSATPNFSQAVKIAEIAKRTCQSTVVYGGVHASTIPEVIIKKYHASIDYIVIGEGEYTLVELIRHLEQGQKPHEVGGICFSVNDQVVRTQQPQLIADLDQLPFPARDLLPQKLFRPNMHNIRHRTCATI